jgi:uncharacterized protein (TIGR00369 family)
MSQTASNPSQQNPFPAGQAAAPRPERTRTFEWLDPATTAARARSMSGLEFLHSVQGERSAPIAEALGFRLAEVAEGRVVFEFEPAEYHYNPIGTVHGGMACTICDSAMGAAVHSTLSKGGGYTSLEVKVNFLRPITAATGTMRCEGEVISRGGRVAMAQARLIDAAGRLYAHATTTCMIFSPEPEDGRNAR